MRFLTVHQVSKVSGVPAKTLWRWAHDFEAKRVGPEPVRLGPRQLRYRVGNVAEWLGEPADTLLTAATA